MNKKELRKQILDFRNSIDRKLLQQYSERIQEKLEQLEYVIEAKNIMCFVSFGSEVYTHKLIKNWLSQGKSVSVPCLEKASKEGRCMHAVRIRDFEDLKETGSFGILEPTLLQCNIVPPESHDVIIVPGSVFDIDKNRMGYGGGFYDKYLVQTDRKCKKIGVCYDFQVLEKIPHYEYDLPVDMLITEKRII